MKLTILIIAVIGLLVIVGLTLTACHRRGAGFGGAGLDDAGRERRINFVKQRIADKLALTEVQKSELDRMIDDLKAKHAEIRSQRPEFKAQIIDVLRREQVHPEDIKQLMESKRPLFEDLLSMIADEVAEFHAMLTPEQRAKLVAELESPEGRCPFGP